MGLVTLTAHVAGTVLTAAALNNNFNAIVNQLNGNVEGANIAALAVTAAKIASNAVTAAKLDNNLIDDLTLVTAVSTDHVMIADASDSGNLKRALVSDIAAAAASQAQMEAASSNVVMATPANINWHPGVAKAWGKFNGTGTPAFDARYNFDASITDNGTGDWTLSLTTDFSSGHFAFSGNALRPASTGVFVEIAAAAAGTIGIKVSGADSNLYDSSFITIMAFGDQ